MINNDFNKTIRAGKKQENKDKNPRYYHLHDHLTYSTFGKKYDLIDQHGRLYKIAFTTEGYYGNDNKEVIKGHYGSIKFNVKLPKNVNIWYNENNINKELVLYYTNEENKSAMNLIFDLTYFFRGTDKRKTGYIFARPKNSSTEALLKEILKLQ